MNIVEKIHEHVKSMQEADQAEVLDFVEYLKYKKRRKDENSEWTQFSLASALKGAEEEKSPYILDDIMGRPMFMQHRAA